MLNKDEYNQEEYNEYYRQETGRAESNNKDEKSGVFSKLILLLILLALTIAGYFGYKAMSKVEESDTSLKVSLEPSLPQTIQKEPDEVAKEITKEELPKVEKETKKEETKEVDQKVESQEKKPLSEVQNKTSRTEQSTVTSEVNKTLSSQGGKMSPEEIAAVVDAVMKQINQKKSSEKPTPAETTKEDSTLINELSDAKVDSVSDESVKELESVDISENTKIDNSQKQIDVYNKVNVQGVSGSDTLSQLAAQINQEINNNPQISSTTTTTNEEDKGYSTNIKKEVVFRKKEMRIIIVKRGDTLGKLAKRAYGNAMEYKRIYQANPEVTRPDRIYIGQKLRIPN